MRQKDLHMPEESRNRDRYIWLLRFGVKVGTARWRLLGPLKGDRAKR